VCAVSAVLKLGLSLNWEFNVGVKYLGAILLFAVVQISQMKTRLKHTVLSTCVGA